MAEITDPSSAFVELREKIRYQFDAAPYPNRPLEEQPSAEELVSHDLVIPFYLRDHQVVNPAQMSILDAGCGSGYRSFVLAQANPGAQIVGVDLSAQSVELAGQRFHYHGLSGATFHELLIEDLPKLGLQFDYINCDDVLYLLPDPIAGLKAFKAVLKPTGILRANLHSAHQRDFYFRAQRIFRMMGLLEENPRELEITIVRETMTSLKDDVLLKQMTWNPARADEEAFYLMNYLFQGDTGYTIPDLFDMLESAGLAFFEMTQWQSWHLSDLFKDPKQWPDFLAKQWQTWSTREQLSLFELLDSADRLLDFWCVHPDQLRPRRSLHGWTRKDWERSRVSLHPRLKLNDFRRDLETCFATHRSFRLGEYWQCREAILLDSRLASILFLLWQAPQTFSSLLAHWLLVCPVNLVTLEPTSQTDALQTIVDLLIQLEAFCCVLIESQ